MEFLIKTFNYKIHNEYLNGNKKCFEWRNNKSIFGLSFKKLKKKKKTQNNKKTKKRREKKNNKKQNH